MGIPSDLSLLCSIYENAKIGSEALADILPKVNDLSLRGAIDEQLYNYKAIESEAASRLIRNGKRPQELSGLSRFRIWSDVQINTMLNKSVGHVAELLIHDATTGITEITKRLNNSRRTSENTQRLAMQLLHTEQNNINRLKGFLS